MSDEKRPGIKLDLHTKGTPLTGEELVRIRAYAATAVKCARIEELQRLLKIAQNDVLLCECIRGRIDDIERGRE